MPLDAGLRWAGTLQTENIGLEKVICNLVSNPNIRYLIVCGPEFPGHLVGGTILALARDGMDENKRVVGSEAPTPYLFNIPTGQVERFRKQITVIDLLNEGSPEVLRQAVCACYQEEPTPLRDYMLYDPGAYPEPPLSGKITWRVIQPEREPKGEEEWRHAGKVQALSERIREALDLEEKRRRAGGASPKAAEEEK
ncbi:MAG: hypothetical protein V1878_07195 [bacterium]